MRHQCDVLSNGLRVVQTPMPGVHSVSICVFIGVGSRFESPSQAGISHLIEHMVFKATDRRPSAPRISETLDAVGGILNASTDKELTIYWAKVAREHLPLAIDLLADMLLHSRLSAGDLAREKNVIVEELNMLADDPQDWVHVLADDVLWPQQAVGREVAGTRESIRTLHRDDLLRHMATFYGANNTVISLAGGIDSVETLALIQAQFGDWPSVPAPTAATAIFPDGAPRSRIERKPIEQVNLCLVYPGISRDHPDRWSLDVLCSMLGGGMSSRLFVQLRERQGLVYDVHAYPGYMSDTGSVVIYAGMEAGRTQRALEAIFHEVERLQTRRVTGAELRKAKQYFRGRLWLSLEDSHAVAGWFGAQEMLEREVITPEQALEAAEAVSAEDVLKVAKTYLDPQQARLAAVGPVGELGLEAQLAGA